MATSAFNPIPNRSGPRAPRSGPRSEDAQPNESVNRRQRYPPTVNSAATHTRRPWWIGRGPHRPPIIHQNVQPGVRERAGSTRRAPSSTSANRANPYARPRPLATTGGRRCPNTAQNPIDTNPRQPREGHSASTPSMPTSGSPAPKRRKLEGSPSGETKREIPTETMTPVFALSVSPVSSETLVSDHKVKMERSISLELYSKPQLNTSGSKRYAPLPLECRKSHPNHTGARSAWARKEQEALRRLGLRVVRTFIREDGMVIDWEANSEPTDTAAVIERALLLNDAAIRSPPVLSAERATSLLTSASQSSKRRRLDEGNDVPFAVEIAPREDPTGPAPSVEGPGPDANRIRSPSRNSSMDRRCPSQTQATHIDTGDNAVARVRTPAPFACFLPDEGLCDTAPTLALPPSPCQPRSPMRHQTTNNALSHPTSPSSQVRMRASSSQSTRLLHGRSTSPRPFPSPPPSQHALNALHHILQLKRKIIRSSCSAGPSAVSPSPSCSLRKLYPTPKETQPETPSKRPMESSADIVAAALNESARLSQRGLGKASASSTPLRVYKKRRSPAVTLARGNGKNTVPRNERGHRERDSVSPERHSSPPIAVLGLTGSLPGSPLTELTPSVTGGECDELDLSYPSSPRRPSPDMISHRPSADVPTELPRPVEPTELVGGPSLSNVERPSLEEKATVRSAALHYLERYCRTFDTDRRALAEAYAPDAAFSCPSRSLRTQGRDGILNALTTFGNGVFCSGGRNVDVVPGIGVLLVVLGTMIYAQDDRDREVGYTMSFVLQPGDHEDRQIGRSTGQWPFVAILHQIVLREGS